MNRLTLADLPPAAQKLFAFWEEARADKCLPDRRAISPLRLREWIGDLSIVQVHEGERRFWVRLSGTNIVTNIGTGFERSYLEDRIPDELHKVALEPYYVSLKECLPTYSVIMPGLLTGVFSQLERFILPFSDVDGGCVERFLVWAAPSDRDCYECETVYGTRAGQVNNAMVSQTVNLSIISADHRPVELASVG